MQKSAQATPNLQLPQNLWDDLSHFTRLSREKMEKVIDEYRKLYTAQKDFGQIEFLVKNQESLDPEFGFRVSLYGLLVAHHQCTLGNDEHKYTIPYFAEVVRSCHRRRKLSRTLSSGNDDVLTYVKQIEKQWA